MERERIRSQIEETRAEMSETIDAIQQRLSPRRLMSHAKVPVAILGLGAAWLLVRTLRQRSPT
jgi:hypothetical protein